MCLVTQSCPTLFDPGDCSPPGSSVHEDSPGKNTRVGCHALLQGIFPTQGLNPGLPHLRQSLCHLSHKVWGTIIQPYTFVLSLLLFLPPSIIFINSFLSLPFVCSLSSFSFFFSPPFLFELPYQSPSLLPSLPSFESDKAKETGRG